MMTAAKFFTASQKNAIESAIAAAEKETSGEIRVHIETSCKIDVLDRAAFMFAKLEMHKTAQRNGVLFYLAVNDRKFAILGDAGINANVPKDFWNNVKDLMLNHFKEGKYTEGLVAGIALAGEKLKEHFPYNQAIDKNELPDEISFS
jgi:uncharacterized membrane protein